MLNDELRDAFLKWGQQAMELFGNLVGRKVAGEDTNSVEGDRRTKEWVKANAPNLSDLQSNDVWKLAEDAERLIDNYIKDHQP